MFRSRTMILNKEMWRGLRRGYVPRDSSLNGRHCWDVADSAMAIQHPLRVQHAKVENQ